MNVRPARRRLCTLCPLLLMFYLMHEIVASEASKLLVAPPFVTLLNPSPAAGEEYGSSLAAVGTDKVLVGAWRDFKWDGAAYLYGLDGKLLTTFTNPIPHMATDPLAQ